MKTVVLIVALVVSGVMLSTQGVAAGPKDPALYKEVAAQLKESRQRLQVPIDTICKKRPELCNSSSNTLQLGCSRMSCRLPRNPEEVLGHAECIEKWLLSCL